MSSKFLSLKDFFLQSETIWFLIGLVLILLEFAVPGLVLVFFGVGAWVTALVCLFVDVGINAQLAIFLISSIISLALLRRVLKKRYMDHLFVQGDGLEDEYIGKTATAIKSFGVGELGKVSFKGSDWEAITKHPVKEGQLLKITGYKSVRLFVEPIQ